MTQKLELYKCITCTNVVELVHEGIGTLVCCGTDMNLLKENTPDVENAHYAYVEELDDITKKVVVKHVMTPEHYIEFIEVISNDKKFVKRKFLAPKDPCELTFKCDCKEGFFVRLFCNLDGVWVTK